MESESVRTNDEKLEEIAWDILKEGIAFCRTGLAGYDKKEAGANEKWLAGMLVTAGDKAKKYLDILQIANPPKETK
jgi:hypothetical protein